MMTTIMEAFWKERVVEYDFDSPTPPTLTRPNTAPKTQNKKGDDVFYVKDLTLPTVDQFLDRQMQKYFDKVNPTTMEVAEKAACALGTRAMFNVAVRNAAREVMKKLKESRQSDTATATSKASASSSSAVPAVARPISAVASTQSGAVANGCSASPQERRSSRQIIYSRAGH